MDAPIIAGRLLHRDAAMLVLNKPAGLPVHPGRGGGPTLTDSLDDLRFGLPRRPEAVHRLDKDTAGCLVLGRHRTALARLNALFASGAVSKLYWAIVDGEPADEAGTIDLPLARRSPHPTNWQMRPDPAGQPALTRWRVLGRAGGRAWLELKPITGRTHQLRVHCAAMGWAIAGDKVYGRAAPDGMHLLARSIAIPFRPGKPPVTVEAPPPPAMASVLAMFGPATA